LDFLAAILVNYISDPSVRPLPLLGKTFDLVSAYKQFPVSLEDRRVLRIATLDPSSHVPAVFGVNALPFGASGSVAAFLRTSASLWSLGALELGLCWGAFFDDFPTLTSAENASSTDLAVDGLFSLLGVSYAKTGDKNKPFAPVFKALGVEIDLSEVSDRRVYFKHTPERKAELVAALDGFLQSGRMSQRRPNHSKDVCNGLTPLCLAVQQVSLCTF
jgi:hypothetical protein